MSLRDECQPRRWGMSAERRIDVTLGFSVRVSTDEPAEEVGRDLIDHLMFAGNPRRAPEAVVFIRATEVSDGD